MADTLEELKNKGESQLFYPDHVEEVGQRHVAWIDLMGILDHLENEQIYPAVLRGELLAVVSEYIDEDLVTVFTIGDGVIITTEHGDYLNEFLDALFLHYARFNVENWRNGDDVYFNRLIRAGVGYGDIHRIDVEKHSADHFEGNVFHGNFANKPFGPGLIKALRAEEGAPYSIHEYNDDATISPVHWWKRLGLDEDSRIDVLRMLNDYFDWYDGNYRYRYEPYDRGHFEMALDYFEIDPADV